jgi:hypothetical protein
VRMLDFTPFISVSILITAKDAVGTVHNKFFTQMGWQGQ